LRQKLGSWFRKPSSKRKKGRVAGPKPDGAEVAQEPNPQATSTTAPDTLLVTTQAITIKQDTIDPAQEAAGFDLAIALIDIIQPVEFTPFISPTPVGMALEQVTKILRVLKVGSLHGYSVSTNIWAIKRMVENKGAWKELYETLVEHGDEFNQQLIRLKQNNTKPNEESAMLAPLKRYST